MILENILKVVSFNFCFIRDFRTWIMIKVSWIQLRKSALTWYISYISEENFWMHWFYPQNLYTDWRSISGLLFFPRIGLYHCMYHGWTFLVYLSRWYHKSISLTDDLPHVEILVHMHIVRKQISTNYIYNFPRNGDTLDKFWWKKKFIDHKWLILHWNRVSSIILRELTLWAFVQHDFQFDFHLSWDLIWKIV